MLSLKCPPLVFQTKVKTRSNRGGKRVCRYSTFYDDVEGESYSHSLSIIFSKKAVDFESFYTTLKYCYVREALHKSIIL